ncbi:MAG: hypothetical protein KGO81_04470 [Bacteroidota bacterium]|nr:hypothetical protein [Bacteroidota bacterium]
MSEHHHDEGGVVKSFTLTAFLSFALIFCVLLLMSTCHGPFKGFGKEKAATEQTTESHAEQH